MKRSSIFAPGILALSISAISNAHAYDNLYVFGDSLSDSGNNGRYTVDGKTSDLYHDIIARKLGTELAHSNSGGTNYAAGGATAVASLNSKDNTQDQITRYLASHDGRADSNGMYVHWIGGNDVKDALKDLGKAQDTINKSANAAASQVHMLLDAGAGLVIVPTVPDVGVTPKLMETIISEGLAIGGATSNQVEEALNKVHAAVNQNPTLNEGIRLQVIQGVFKSIGFEASGGDAKKAEVITQQLIDNYEKHSRGASDLVDSYNRLEDIKLSQGNGNIVRADVNALLHEVIADPLRYGFLNTIGYACPQGVNAKDCDSNNPDFDKNMPFLFADDFHPTPAAQHMIGQYIISILNAPEQAMLLTKANNVPVKGALASLDGRLQQLRGGGNEQGKIGVFGGYSGNHNHTLTLGSDYQLTDNILLGGMISRYQDNRSANNFRYDGRGYVFTAYGLWRYYDKGWMSGDLHYLDMKYEDITRGIVLNEGLHNEHASTTGHQWGGRITAGWDIPLASTVMTSPIIQYAWDKSYVKGYRELGNRSTATAMHFSDQRYDSQVGTLGWRLDTNFGRFNPYAEVRFNHQFGEKHYQIRSAINSTETFSTRKSPKQDTDWREYIIGMNAVINKDWGAFASISRNDGDVQNYTYSFSLGVNASF